jgi:hypothetical protein
VQNTGKKLWTTEHNNVQRKYKYLQGVRGSVASTRPSLAHGGHFGRRYRLFLMGNTPRVAAAGSDQSAGVTPGDLREGHRGLDALPRPALPVTAGSSPAAIETPLAGRPIEGASDKKCMVRPGHRNPARDGRFQARHRARHYGRDQRFDASNILVAIAVLGAGFFRRTKLDPLGRQQSALRAGLDRIHESKHDGFRILARQDTKACG